MKDEEKEPTYKFTSMPEFDEQKSSGLSEWGICMPFGMGKPYVPPVYPEPKYAIGTRYQQDKYFDWDDKPIEGNYKVWCTITGKSYYNGENMSNFGWIYNSIPEEPVQVGDNYWGKHMSESAWTSDQALDKYFKSIEDENTER